MANNSRRGHGLYSEVPEETYQGLAQIAKRRGETLRFVLIKAIDQYIAADNRRERKRDG